jgi:hypothetical protein
LRYDRRDRDAGGEGEGNQHSDKYLFHWTVTLSAGYPIGIAYNIRFLFLRENTYYSPYGLHAGAP